MTEAPRPPGDDPYRPPADPTSPPAPPGSYSMPGEEPTYRYPPPSSGPPSSGPPGPGGYAPPPQGGYPPPPPGGYPPPGPGGYGPPAGYGPPGGYQPGYPGGAPVAGYANNDERTWALVAHFGGALGALLGAGTGGWVAPLVALLAKGNMSPTVRAHSVAALNFQITMTIAAIIGWTIGCLLLFIPGVVVMVIAIVFGILGGVRANEGQLYRYPMTINMVK